MCNEWENTINKYIVHMHCIFSKIQDNKKIMQLKKYKRLLFNDKIKKNVLNTIQ